MATLQLKHWMAPAVLAAGLGLGALVPAPAQAQDSLTRILVDVADVVLQGGQPYYRYGSYGANDRVYVQRDRYGRPVYYRVVPARPNYGYSGNRYYNSNAYNAGYYDPRFNTGYPVQTAQRVNCSGSGNCTVKYYDPRYDHRDTRARYDRPHHGRGGHRGHDDDDD
ncbi:hypothetical protein LYSHEL_09600 [Lysobacter helvus]|uniref:Uncharacterized protein n=2 Tax=Lysobacteraceae TaxID=32033 RepID=A0ABM7Q3Q5_9GAMM|nr:MULTISPECIES: hypothetical protein [Lysobacter]BCT91936.1 hypothetical protein LYSCAS_09600 [Lysobacter caseinilyticus]BCT95089.1 hypothetical protein LYSHEL_09600 [Lysobacter helvus]